MKDEKLLIWFLSSGISAIEKSPLGGMIDMLQMRSAVTKPCTHVERIAGKSYPCVEGIVVAPREMTDQHGNKELVPFGDWCPACGGTGFLPVYRKDNRATITARPMHPESHSVRDEPDDEVLANYAVAIRRISKMTHNGAAALIEAYGHHGEIAASDARAGAPWAAGRGRAWAVAHLTDSGRAMIADYLSAHQDDDIDSPMRVLEKIVRRNELTRDNATTQRIARVVLESVTLLARAEKEWDNASE